MIYLDIETIPDQREGAKFRAMADIKVPANYKNPEAIRKYREEHAEKAWLNTALDGTYGEVFAIGYKLPRKPIEVLCRSVGSFNDKSERDLLTAFFNVVEDYCAKDSPPESRRGDAVYTVPRFIGHCVDFDLRFLWQRKVIHGIPTAVDLPHKARAWQGKYVDTAYEWTGKEHGIGLKALHKAIKGLPPCAPDDLDIDGANVWENVSEGNYDAVIEHCRKDVQRVVDIHRAIGGGS